MMRSMSQSEVSWVLTQDGGMDKSDGVEPLYTWRSTTSTGEEISLAEDAGSTLPEFPSVPASSPGGSVYSQATTEAVGAVGDGTEAEIASLYPPIPDSGVESAGETSPLCSPTQPADAISLSESEPGRPLKLVDTPTGLAPSISDVSFPESLSDMVVCPVAVVGKERGGKSFLLHFIIQYLEWKFGGTAEAHMRRLQLDWVPATAGEGGFEWRGGSGKVTSGIWVWSKPYIIQRPDGQKPIAVLLFDTQGTYGIGGRDTDRLVFTLSALFSSCMVAF
jgi:Guanylate-binding protein, N-terminal domain